MRAFFLARNPDFFRKNAEVESYIDYIKKENPDVCYLTEVCWIEQRDMLVSGLENCWYKTHTIEWFELWNMQEESHRYLYHIMASKIDFRHNQTEQQYTSNSVIRFLKWKNGLNKEDISISEKIAGILDGGWSRYTIWDMEVWLMHAHSIDQTTVFYNLMAGLASSGNNRQVLVWDVNMKTEFSEEIARNINPNIQRIETNRTYPYCFTQSKWWILTRTINWKMLSWCLPFPDQAFVNPIGVGILNTRSLWPEVTWLKTDHAVNHFYLESK